MAAAAQDLSMNDPKNVVPMETMLTELRPYSAEWYDVHRRTLGEAGCRQLGFYALPPELLLSVVIPVYNEERTLRNLVERVCAVPIRKELILVDDCSRDGTREVLKQLAANSNHDPFNSLSIHYHDVNKGKGGALRTGFEHARGDFVIIQDADLEYDPSEYPRLLQPIVEGNADVVFGSRFLGDQPHRVLYFWHYLGNKLLTTASNCFTNLNLTDMETCYKVFRREVIQEIAPKLKQNRFGFEPEITARLSRRGCRVYEMSISYSGRTYEEGKKIGLKDAFQALWCIVRYGIAD
jgi:glycosyltransferase involved in cell wall biosynthesis